jgi:hypothetical protein
MMADHVVVMDMHPDKDNWITNRSGIPVSVACQDLFGSSAFDLEPGETKEISFDITANVYPLGQYSYGDLKYSLSQHEHWEVGREQDQLVMRKVDVDAARSVASAPEVREAPKSAPPADWYKDPADRHQYRFWDGLSWTEHVADDGRQSADPVSGPGTVTVSASGSGSASTSVQELVDAIIREYRERAQLAARYDAEVKATHGVVWQSPTMDEVRKRAAEIDAAAVAKGGSSHLEAMGPDAVPSILEAVAARSDDLRQWGMSRSGLEEALAKVLSTLGEGQGSEAAARLKAMLW